MPTNNSNSNANNIGTSINLLDGVLMASFALGVMNTDANQARYKKDQEQMKTLNDNIILLNENLEKMINILGKGLDNKEIL